MARIRLEKWLDEQIADAEKARVHCMKTARELGNKGNEKGKANFLRYADEWSIRASAWARAKRQLVRSPDALKPLICHVPPYDPKRRY
jgi:hypothetical protein